MKLIIKEYLASLKERNELDALLPDLLSQMGLHIFSRPGIGNRQYGVDIAAVGRIDGEPEKVYLLSVKSGDLGRKDWNSGSVQDLQPSLDEIISVYIPTHLPSEHRGKPIEICICIGGDVKEEVRLNITQYEESKRTESLSIVEWDGDRLSAMVEKHFLREDLVPEGIRPLLRKSLALLDEPEASFAHFSNLIFNLRNIDFSNDNKRLTALRQMNICLWILFAWARDCGNLESAYVSSERTLLNSWDISKNYFQKKSKIAKSIQSTFSSILSTYQIVTTQYLSKVVAPHAHKLHGLSSAVSSTEKLDVNLKLFEILGRLSISGLWSQWGYLTNGDKPKIQERYDREINLLTRSLKQLISNNPTLLLPIKDEQVIDISLALLLLSFRDGNDKDCINWLTEMLERAVFSHKTHGSYPCIYRDYSDLLEHPKKQDKAYQEEATSGSVLYPTIALWGALLENFNLFKSVQKAHEESFSHCNFQFWYPGKTSEEHIYRNSDIHGSTFSHVPIDQNPDEFLEAVWNECDHSGVFKELSSVKSGLWPMLLVACRHYRLPIPLDFTLGYREQRQHQEDKPETATSGSE